MKEIFPEAYEGTLMGNRLNSNDVMRSLFFEREENICQNLYTYMSTANLVY